MPVRAAGLELADLLRRHGHETEARRIEESVRGHLSDESKGREVNPVYKRALGMLDGASAEG